LLPAEAEQLVFDLASAPVPASCLGDITHVIHLAARVHDQQGSIVDTNRRITRNLLANIHGSRVERFLYVSSIGVLGPGGGAINRPLREDSENPKPLTRYGMSKLECETLVRNSLAGSPVAWTIVRPPVIYGYGAGGSFGALSRLVRSGLPLPFSTLDNGRTMVSLNNLVSLLVRCLWHPAARNELFHVCDNETLSMVELIRTLEYQSGRRASRLLPCPRWLLRWAGSLVGRRAMVEQLMQPLWLSAEKAGSLLGWSPVESVYEGLERGMLAEDRGQHVE
jgi:UDP-glucose 4-epimerase